MSSPSSSIALYGGSFDPVHRGHLRVARAAVEKFALDRVAFVPAGAQPFKSRQAVTAYEHRFAMLELALAGEARFTVSRLESPEALRESGAAASYTIDTVRRLRTTLTPGTRLFLLLGMDAFQLIAKWRYAVELLRSTECIVASRPGFPLTGVLEALPAELRPARGEAENMLQRGELRTTEVAIHLLPGVHEDVSATAIRQAVRSGLGLDELVPAPVAEYILANHLYAEPDDVLPTPARP
ncbi:MAG: nicotinate-nucleotide adenylyltransferase [Acidobacteriota bacterium]|nr:nicotinate-nucleotide adenylyltransferase [Acidobacteriota bacterium]